MSSSIYFNLIFLRRRLSFFHIGKIDIFLYFLLLKRWNWNWMATWINLLYSWENILLACIYARQKDIKSLFRGRHTWKQWLICATPINISREISSLFVVIVVVVVVVVVVDFFFSLSHYLFIIWCSILINRPNRIHQSKTLSMHAVCKWLLSRVGMYWIAYWRIHIPVHNNSCGVCIFFFIIHTKFKHRSISVDMQSRDAAIKHQQLGLINVIFELRK